MQQNMEGELFLRIGILFQNVCIFMMKRESDQVICIKLLIDTPNNHFFSFHCKHPFLFICMKWKSSQPIGNHPLHSTKPNSIRSFYREPIHVPNQPHRAVRTKLKEMTNISRFLGSQRDLLSS